MIVRCGGNVRHVDMSGKHELVIEVVVMDVPHAAGRNNDALIIIPNLNELSSYI